MAKRTRKQKERAVTRRPVSSSVPAAPSGGIVLPRDTTPVAAAADTSARRRVERVSPAAAPGAVGLAPGSIARRPQRGQPSGFIQPLESDDAAIPFDRVPYVPADLRRVAIIATVMILLIVVADIIVSNVVK